jgi:hypothetical protein
VPCWAPKDWPDYPRGRTRVYAYLDDGGLAQVTLGDIAPLRGRRLTAFSAPRLQPRPCSLRRHPLITARLALCIGNPSRTTTFLFSSNMREACA